MKPIRILIAAVLLTLVPVTAAARDVPVLEIADDRLQDYWTPTAQVTRNRMDPEVFMTRSGRLKPLAEKVTVSYVIGSDGQVRDAKVVESEPGHLSARWALVAVQGSSYEPAAGNPDRTPVRITHTVTMKSGLPGAD